jgi:large subunit ribosomal protein L15
VERPRWSYTPEQMKAPFHPRTKDPRKAWQVNEDPEKLDKMYIKFLGKGGDKVLTEEIKWLAVTHKSFDQGRRGFNDRLAFFGEIFARTRAALELIDLLGKRILLLQGTLAMLHSPLTTATRTTIPDPYDRTPFQHPALEGLQNLPTIPISEVISKQRLGRLATSYGIGEVTRWKPKNVSSYTVKRLKWTMKLTMGDSLQI